MKDLLRKMLVANPEKRIEWKDLHKHHIFNNKKEYEPRNFLKESVLFGDRNTIIKQNIEHDFKKNPGFYDNFDLKTNFNMMPFPPPSASPQKNYNDFWGKKDEPIIVDLPEAPHRFRLIN